MSGQFGQFPVDHGSMCAFDSRITAPRATLLDIPVLLSRRPVILGLLSDAIMAFAHLRIVLAAMPQERRALVIARAGARSSPAGTSRPGPRVLSIGGVDVRGARVGYSSQGPGRPSRRKPDVCTFTHFARSKTLGPNKPDSGTSAACPVAAGVVAAVRSQLPAGELPPAQQRTHERHLVEAQAEPEAHGRQWPGPTWRDNSEEGAPGEERGRHHVSHRHAHERTTVNSGKFAGTSPPDRAAAGYSSGRSDEPGSTSAHARVLGKVRIDPKWATALRTG